MRAAEEAAAFREAIRLPDFKQLIAEWAADGYTGAGLYRKVFDKLCTKTCFVAGTLIWTDNGRVPIEQIQVGDLVLSKPETNDGPQAYKRVVKTFYFDDLEVEFVEVTRGH